MTFTLSLAKTAFATMTLAHVLVASAYASDALVKDRTVAADDQFARPQQLVDIGGRRLNMYCSGAGSPTVVFDAYSGGSGWVWAKVQPEVAKQTRACVYDRAGLGFSDPSNRPGNSENAVEDLHKLLVAAGIKPPYVMVGNSYGGLNVQLYTYRFPAEVSGLVLVEAGNENETARYDRATNGKISQLYAQGAELGKQCLSNAERGFVPGSAILEQCGVISLPGVGRSLAAALFAQALSPSYWKANISEDENYRASEAQLGAARKPLGDMPLAVLTRGVSPYAIPGKPQSALNKALEDENNAIHDEVAKLSSRGTNRVVKGAGHLIQNDKPDEVVRSISEVLAQVRASHP
ncbi:MAG: alpha/beta hydrolase [Massilia sp.]